MSLLSFLSLSNPSRCLGWVFKPHRSVKPPSEDAIFTSQCNPATTQGHSLSTIHQSLFLYSVLEKEAKTTMGFPRSCESEPSELTFSIVPRMSSSSCLRNGFCANLSLLTTALMESCCWFWFAKFRPPNHPDLVWTALLGQGFASDILAAVGSFRIWVFTRLLRRGGVASARRSSWLGLPDGTMVMIDQIRGWIWAFGPGFRLKVHVVLGLFFWACVLWLGVGDVTTHLKLVKG